MVHTCNCDVIVFGAVCYHKCDVYKQLYTFMYYVRFVCYITHMKQYLLIATPAIEVTYLELNMRKHTVVLKRLIL
jgi:hypothetical protein